MRFQIEHLCRGVSEELYDFEMRVGGVMEFLENNGHAVISAVPLSADEWYIVTKSK